MTTSARSLIERASITPAAEPLTQAERTARRTAFRDAFEKSAEALGYVPHDSEKARAYALQQGIADAWPIDLTPCTK